ncbi:MAG: family 78 glycoside hydrolase catalytic domain [Opitutaceae bacterium]
MTRRITAPLFRFAGILALTFKVSAFAATDQPTKINEESPVSIVQDASGVYIVDFGRVAFGNILLSPPERSNATITVHFGEDFTNGRVNRKPSGTVRYNQATVTLTGADSIIAAPPADSRNTRVDRNAVLTPKEWGVILPFRWVEIEGWKGELLPEHITRRAAYSSNWDDNAATFECSDEMLNRIWELCKWSIKATTFAGVYVDGDRERIPYEADAYLNQLSHYYTDNDIQMARDTYDYLMQHPTWPTEWASHMIFMAHADWMHTGDAEWLRPRYSALESKLLLDRVKDSLVHSNDKQIKRDDIVDWPKGERDGFVFTEVNTVVNAFYIRSLFMMADLADALELSSDASKWREMASNAQIEFQAQLFDSKSGRYNDGIHTHHQSAHANLFPLALDLVPVEQRPAITDWLVERGMSCSVYAAQYLLEALFENGASQAAVDLMTAPTDRSWRHMVESGATITWEAWDMKYKSNQDWNHAWGAAPANLLPRYVLGAEALTPGWQTARIRPQPSGLSFAKGKVPTPHGPILIEWEQGDAFTLSLDIPPQIQLQLELPVIEGGTSVLQDGRPIPAKRVGNRWILNPSVQGKSIFVVESDSKE